MVPMRAAVPGTVALLCAAAVALGQDAPNPESAGASPGPALRPGEVRFRPPEGTKLAYTLATKLQLEQKVPKRKFTGRGEVVSDLEITVGRREDDGTRALDVRVLRTTGWFEDTEHPRVAIDTAKEPVPPDSPARQMVQWIAPPSFRVHDDARIAEIAALLPDQRGATALPRADEIRREYESAWSALFAHAAFAPVWPALPPKPTGAGTFFETGSLPPWPYSSLYRLNLRHEVKLLDATRLVLETKGGVDDLDPANQAGRSKKKGEPAPGRRLQSSGFAAASEVDRADGVVRKSSARFTIVHAQTFTVDGDSVEGTATCTRESVLERKPEPQAAAPK